MPKICDHTSVGVVIKNIDGNIALLERARGSVGMAPAAGHVDNHGSFAQAAVDEVQEEIGLIVAPEDLMPTKIADRRINNRCRRENGDHHLWTVYEVDQFVGDITPDPDETKGARWYPKAELQKLADRTKSYKQGKISDDDWRAAPGIEVVWLDFLTELGYVK
jgi:8-oxo-dGTP pyrophosphatase MutT (NUDIX family)